MRSSIIAALLLLATPSVPAAEAKPPTSAKRFNLRANPLGLLGGFSNLVFDVGVMQDLTVGPSYSRVSISFADTTITGQGFGIRANSFLYGPRLAGNWYFGPSIARYAIDATHVRSGQTGTTSVKVTSIDNMDQYTLRKEDFPARLMNDDASLRLGQALRLVRGEKASFYFTCLYLVFEYVRPLSIYPVSAIRAAGVKGYGIGHCR